MKKKNDCLLKQLDFFPVTDLCDEILIKTEKYLNLSDQIRLLNRQ